MCCEIGLVACSGGGQVERRSGVVGVLFGLYGAMLELDSVYVLGVCWVVVLVAVRKGGDVGLSRMEM